jgi:lysyl-tRNA synthetase class 2
VSEQTESPVTAPGGADELPEQMRVRREKLDRMREKGVDPYPVGFPRTKTISVVRNGFTGLEADTQTGVRVGVVGRVMLSRTGGKLCFATLRDESGEVQVMISLDKVGAESLAAWKSDVDLGDHVGVEGEVITSRRGELSILVDNWAITSKCLRPLPDQHAGFTDPEARVRMRYVDLIMNEESRKTLRLRSGLVRALRRWFDERDYVEVETPMLQPVHGGATARPFVTHINAYDMELFMRIAPELYLKRLSVGGVEKVFEINRNFRNEGADSTHNPEFTMLEAYEAYGDYNTMATLIRELLQYAAREVFGTTVFNHNGVEVDIDGEWDEITVYGSASKAVGAEITVDTPIEQVWKLADANNVEYDKKWGQGKLVQEIYEALVEGTLIRPTFVRDFPVETSPLTRGHRTMPGLTEKWDLIGFGMELGTAYSELVDPIEQRKRLTEQSLLAAGGDVEAMQLDEDFLRALEYAMPPSGGMGMGIDRVLMAFTGKGIRDTILFPLVKPE